MTKDKEELIVVNEKFLKSIWISGKVRLEKGCGHQGSCKEQTLGGERNRSNDFMTEKTAASLRSLKKNGLDKGEEIQSR